MPQEDLTQKYFDLARELHQRYGYPVSVVRAKESKDKVIPPLIVSQDKIKIYIIAPLKKNPALAQRIMADYSPLRFDCNTIGLPNEMVEIVKKDPARWRDSLGGYGFLTPFVYHEEIIHIPSKYGPKIRKAFRKKFGRLFDLKIRQRILDLEKSRKNAEKQNNAKLRQIEERGKKLLGPIEQRELTKQLENIALDIYNSKTEVLIVFDKSGRPLAQPLRTILKKTFGWKGQIFFLHPGKAKLALDPTQLNQQLERELPDLVKSVKGKSIALVDDQPWKGRSFENIAKMLKKYEPKRISYTYLSIYGINPQPSWRIHGKHRFQNPETAGRSFVSKRRKLSQKERKEIEKMEAKLRRISIKVAQNINYKRAVTMTAMLNMKRNQKIRAR